MTNTQDIGSLAQKWYQENHAKHGIRYKENDLFCMLYKAYCCRSGEEDQWEKFSTEYDFRDACDRIYGWYKKTYETGFRMPAGGKGQKRVAEGRDKYTFNLCYSGDRSFKRYLIDGQHGSGSAALFSFVLHMAVAFLVRPDQLDKVLQKLGFHPLHVKNIHHLAIYYVLLTFSAPGGELQENPFDRVRELYLRAQEILEEPGDAPKDAYSYANQLTWLIRQKLFVEKGIGRENFEKLVKLNKDSLNMRHSLLLKDFYMLKAIFSNVFDDTDFSLEEQLKPNAGEQSYSFYAFVGRYCWRVQDRKSTGRKNQSPEPRSEKMLPRDKYREWLGMVAGSGKHPTREVMILLWMFAYCFIYIPGVYIDTTPFERIKAQLEEADPGRKGTTQRFYDGEFLDVYGLITASKGARDMEEFRGDEMLGYINEKLRLYGWAQMNRRNSFDYYIMQLEHLVMHLDRFTDFDRCEWIKYQNVKLTGVPAKAYNVPCPLVAITWIMHHIKAVHLLHPEGSPVPLESNLYEQI